MIKMHPQILLAASHANAVEETKTKPSSQDSSFNEANTSQQSRTTVSSTESFQRSHPSINSDGIPSSNCPSSHSSQANDAGNASEAQAAYGEGYDTGRTAHTEFSSTHLAVGQKRTATGQVKWSSYGSLPTSPISSSNHEHSRNTSIASRSSQIGEMSDKLHARLFYAKVKLQHGWENHSISDLERMTSDRASLTPASSHTARHATPATSSPVNHSRSSRVLGNASVNTSLDYSYSAQHHLADTRSSGDHLNEVLISGTEAKLIAKPNETYEQFWQSHSNALSPMGRVGDSRTRNGRSLAPPVDFSSRDIVSNKQKPARTDPDSFPGRLPSTPPPRSSALAKIRTPSQQAAVEQDALEGLLSMNSPANSQSYSLARPALRSPLHQHVTEPSLRLNGIVNSISISNIRPSQRVSAAREMSNEEMNRMLDSMPDSSSSDEDNLTD